MKNRDSTKLILLRHGEVYNPKSILYGRLPGFGLSSKGIKDVQTTYEALKNESIHAVFSSPLLRARQTAKVIANKLGLTVRIDNRITEVKLYCEGVNLSEFKSALQPSLYSEENYKKGQESIEEIASRMKSFVNFVWQNYMGKTILVVSHGDPIVILQAEISHHPFTWEFKKENYVNTANYRIITLGRDTSEWNIQ